jgi:altronate hydrolase
LAATQTPTRTACCASSAHPNVGATLLVSLGCEGFPAQLLEEIRHGPAADLLVIQREGGTRRTIAGALNRAPARKSHGPRAWT